MKRSKIDLHRVKREHLIYGGVSVVGLLIGVWLVVAERPGSAPSALDPAGAGAMADVLDTDSSNTAVLFYVAEDGTALVEREHDMPLDSDTLARARFIAEQQLIEPPTPLVSPFPAGTRLRAIYLTDGGNAFVDLSPEVTQAHPGGSLDELFTVYALVNALTTNLPEISAVQILIEGQEVDTLAGHVDLRHPLELNMKWVSHSDADPEADQPPSAEG